MQPRVRAIYKIDPEPGAPAQARRIIAEELESLLPEGVLDDIKLMVSELVTNGIVHGASGEDGPVVLDLLFNGSIRCRVLDHGHGFAERARQAGAGGWGFRLIEQLSDCWGMRCSPRRTEVWFEREPR